MKVLITSYRAYPSRLRYHYVFGTLDSRMYNFALNNPA